MKKVNLVFGLVAMSSLLFFNSCSKEDFIEHEIQKQSVDNNVSTPLLKATGSNYRVWFDNGGSDYGCAGTGGSCLPDVIVTPNIFGQFIPIFKEILSGNKDAIAKTFSSEKDFLSKFIDVTLIDGVINKQLDLKVKGDYSYGLTYLLFYDLNSELLSVYPFKSSTWSNLRVWFDNGGSDYGCAGTGGSCLPDVVVTPSVYAHLSPVFNVIKSGNKIAINNIFTQRKDFLKDYIDKEILDKVISGRYNVGIQGGYPLDTRYILFYTEKNELVLVFPFNK